MKTSSPLDIVTAFMSAMEQKSYDHGLAYVADDIEYINSPGTVARGPEGVRGVLEPFFAPIDENQFVILRTVAQDSRVVLERLDRHRVGSSWFELPVTGVFEVADGKISYWREYFDFDTIRRDMERVFGVSQ